MSEHVPTDLAAISPRESEVLGLLAEHLTYAEIGERLFISARTVETHVNSLRSKLGADDRRQLARVARERALAGSLALGSDVPPLPSPLSSFVGRVRELGELKAALGGSRLVTAVGPGGVGKTRLVLQLAAELGPLFPGGVSYVDLVPVIDPLMVPAAVARATGSTGRSTGTAEGAIVARFRDRHRALLILDNCEHLVDPVAQLVERLLTECGGVTVLVTSRIRLVLPYERTYAVTGLSLPEDEPGGTGEAVELFVERAGVAVEPADVPRIAEVCRSLGGVALAIELAASRLPGLGLDGLESTLADQLGVLAGGPRLAARHRSLQETLTWSYQLLDDASRLVLSRSSVFAAPFDAAAAQQVVGAPPLERGQVAGVLATLCEHSLLTAAATRDGTRYRALESVRQFGTRQLSPADSAVTHARHLAWACSTAEQLSTEDPSSEAWCRRVDTVLDDLRAAVDWSANADSMPPDRTRLSCHVADLLFRRGRLREAQGAYERAAELTVDPHLRATALESAAAVARCRVLGADAARLDAAAARTLLAGQDGAAAALAMARVAEHRVRFSGMYVQPPELEEVDSLLAAAREGAADDPIALAGVAIAEAVRRGGLSTAQSAFDRARATRSPNLTSAALDALTVELVLAGRITEAAVTSRARVEPLLTAGLAPTVGLELKDALHTATAVHVGIGELAVARSLARRHLDLVFTREDTDLAAEEVFAPAALSGHWAEVLPLAAQYRAHWQRSGRRSGPGRAMCPASIALIHGLRGDDANRAVWLDVLSEVRGAARGEGREAYDDVFDAILLLHRGQPRDVLAMLGKPHERTGFHARLFAQWRIVLQAEAAVLAGDAGARQQVRIASRAAVGHPVAELIVRRAAALLADDRESLLAVADAFDHIDCPYQRARTHTLTGGDEEGRGRSLMTSLG